jgi:hypothetical protein
MKIFHLGIGEKRKLGRLECHGIAYLHDAHPPDVNRSEVFISNLKTSKYTTESYDYLVDNSGIFRPFLINFLSPLSVTMTRQHHLVPFTRPSLAKRIAPGASPQVTQGTPEDGTKK